MTRLQNFTVPCDWVRHMIAAAAPGPADLSAALEAAGLSPRDIARPGTLIEQKQEVRFLDALAARSGDPVFAARIGLRTSGRTSTIVSYITQHSRTLADAMLNCGRIIPLTRPAAQIETERTENGVRWTLDNRDPWVAAAPHFQEFVTSNAIAAFRTASGLEVRPQAVRLRDASAAPAEELAALWGCPVDCRGPRHVIEFSAADADLRFREHDAPLLAHLQDYGEMLLAARDAPEPDLRHHVERAVEERLGAGAPQAAEVASDLGMSLRTLTRRLAAMGLTWRGVVEDLRRRKAEALLVNPSLTLGEIAFLLGFAEQSSFTNAFRRWTGLTPGAWRSNRLGRGSESRGG